MADCVKVYTLKISEDMYSVSRTQTNLDELFAVEQPWPGNILPFSMQCRQSQVYHISYTIICHIPSP